MGTITEKDRFYLEVVDANLEIHEDPAGQPDEVRSVD
jgi:hypothetical protein